MNKRDDGGHGANPHELDRGNLIMLGKKIALIHGDNLSRTGHEPNTCKESILDFKCFFFII